MNKARTDLLSLWIPLMVMMMVSTGYGIVCYAESRQITGEQDEAVGFDLSSLYTDKVDPISEGGVTTWKGEFESAAAFFQIAPWDPHPNACPTTPCPPCGSN